MEVTGVGALDTRAAEKAEVWRGRIEAQRASGQSVRAWCLGSGTGEHSFYWWRAKLGLSPQARRLGEGSASAVALARVRVVGSAVRESLCLRLSGERELILPPSMPVSQVAELLVELERRS